MRRWMPLYTYVHIYIRTYLCTYVLSDVYVRTLFLFLNVHCVCLSAMVLLWMRRCLPLYMYVHTYVLTSFSMYTYVLYFYFWMYNVSACQHWHSCRCAGENLYIYVHTYVLTSFWMYTYVFCFYFEYTLCLLVSTGTPVGAQVRTCFVHTVLFCILCLLVSNGTPQDL